MIYKLLKIGAISWVILENAFFSLSDELSVDIYPPVSTLYHEEMA